VLGLLAGAGYAALSPPLLASKTLVLLPASAARFIGTQVVLAGSDPVLVGATRQVDPPVSLRTMRSRVQVTSVTSNILSISAQGETAAQAEGAANAVASSYIAYINSATSPGRPVQAQVLASALIVPGTSPSHRLLVAGGLGALPGALIGVIGAIALSRSDRRLPMT
jgi:capsular polysaccharide biosynthesis protein